MKAVLMWTDPSTSVDGLPLSPEDIAEVAIWEVGQQFKLGSVGAGIQTFTTESLTTGVHVFYAVTTTHVGHQSAPSNMVQITIPEVEDSTPVIITNLSASLIP